MKRRFFNIFTLFSLLLLTGTVGFWIRSYISDDTIEYRSFMESPDKCDRSYWSIQMARGGIGLNGWWERMTPLDDYFRQQWKGSPTGFRWRIAPSETVPSYNEDDSGDVPETWDLFCKYGIGWKFTHTANFGDYMVLLPFRLPALLFSIFPVAATCGRLWKFRRRQFLRLQGLCPNCGYDLRASKDRCPECGTVFTPKVKI